MNKIRELLKQRTREVIAFIVIFAVYNMLVWVIPFKRTGIFAISYVFALISILAFAACYYVAFIRTKTLKGKFLSLPILRIGKRYFIAQLFLSTLFMILTSFLAIDKWVVIVPCVLILAVAIVKTIFIDIARDKMEDIAIKEKVNTSFIRTLHVEIDALANRVSLEPLKEKLSKLSEAVRFSDPVSNATLSEVETKMQDVFAVIKSAVHAGQNDVEPQIDELNNLLLERNKLNRISKPM